MKIKNSKVESTPFTQLEITAKKNGPTLAGFQLYWTENKGIYGYQVAVKGSLYTEEKPQYFEYKTGGCGYCKQSKALEQCILALGITHDEYRNIDHNSSIYKFRTGGNYYKATIGQLKKHLKERATR